MSPGFREGKRMGESGEVKYDRKDGKMKGTCGKRGG